tara:strand:- start:3098 stop:3514 length:417 start_codon:yes stop_codon:yes gene_type:complete
LKADWTTVEFFTKSKKNIGNAEGVDSWFLQLPAFKFNLNNLKTGKYRIALYDGNSCKDYGLPIHKNNPELIDWDPENLINFYVDESGKFNTTLGLKPKITTANNRGLISIGSMRGKPLLIFTKVDNSVFACGLIPIKD